MAIYLGYKTLETTSLPKFGIYHYSKNFKNTKKQTNCRSRPSHFFGCVLNVIEQDCLYVIEGKILTQFLAIYLRYKALETTCGLLTKQTNKQQKPAFPLLSMHLKCNWARLFIRHWMKMVVKLIFDAWNLLAPFCIDCP